jgi:hypothetical protein
MQSRQQTVWFGFCATGMRTPDLQQYEQSSNSSFEQ